MADVKLIDAETGRVVLADEADAVDLVSSGLYAPASAEDVQREAQRLDLSDTGSTIAAGLEGAASGATLGLSDVAVQQGLLGDEFAEESRLRAEYNPIARGVGEAAGVLGTTIASGGAAALEQLGARATARLAGETALRRAMARGAGAGLAGSVEGAVFGAGHELSQAALDHELEDPARLAERMAVAGGMGALMGGALGGAVAGGGSLALDGVTALGRGAQRALRGGGEAAEAVADAGATGAGREAAEGLGGLAAREATDARALVAGATDEDMAVLASVATPPKLRNNATLHQAAEKLDDVQQSSLRTMRDAQDEIARLGDANREALSVAEKPDTIRRIIGEGGGPRESVEHAALGHATSVLDEINELAKQADDYELGGRSAIKLMKQKADSLAARIDEAAQQYRDDPAEQAVQLFRLQDQLKRELGKAQVSAMRGANGSEAAMLRLQEVRERTRHFLEDASVWGDGVAGFQRELNQAWAPLIEIDSAFARAFERQGKASYKAGKSVHDLTRTLADADDGAILAMMGKLGRAEGEWGEGLYRLKLAREIAYQRKASALFDGPPEVAGRAAQMEAAAKRALAALDETRQTTLDAAEYAGQQAALKGLPFGGEQLAKGRESLAKGLAWAREKLGVAPTAAEEAAGASQRGLGSIRDAASAIAKRAQAAAPKARRAARSAQTYLGVRMGALDPERYQQIGDRVRELEDRQSPARVRARDRTALLRQSNPAAADALEGQIERGARFLAGKFRSAAPGARGHDMFAAQKPLKMDARTMSQFLRYVDAVQNPQGALDRAARGELRREDIEVLREVYPTVYADLVTAVRDQAAAATKLPSYQERVRLGLLLGIPTDPSMTPAGLRLTEESAARAAVPPGEGTGPGGVVAGPSGPGGPGPGGAGGNNGAATGGPPPELANFYGPTAERTVIGTTR